MNFRSQHIYRVAPILVGGVLLCLCAPALAESSTEEANRRADPVVVSGSKDDAMREYSTTSRIFIGRAELARYADTQLSDTLRRLPGVTVDSVGGQAPQVRLRGFNSGYARVLIDGEPIPPNFSLDSISPEAVERIEIHRVATAEVSGASIAGVLNIVLRKRVDFGSTVLSATSELRGGKSQSNATATFAGKKPSLDYSLVAVVNRTSVDYPQVGTDERVSSLLDGSFVRRYEKSATESGTNGSVSAKLQFSRPEMARISFDSFTRANSISGSTIERTDAFVGANLISAPNSALIYTWRSNMHRVNLGVQSDFGGALAMDAKVGAYIGRRSAAAAFDTFAIGGEALLNRVISSSSDDRTVFTSGRFKVDLFGQHALVAGWNVSEDRHSEDRIQRDLFVRDFPPNNIDEAYDTVVRQSAIYVQDEWSLSDKFSAYAGVRSEALTTRVSGTSLNPALARVNTIAPSAQLRWTLPTNFRDTVRFAISRSYRAPTAGELTPRRFVASNNSPTTPDLQGNPLLVPELAWGSDGSIERTWRPGALTSVGFFHRAITNVIYPQVRRDPESSQWISSPQNLGRATAYGVEADGKVTFPLVASGVSALVVKANFVKTWSSVAAIPSPGNQLNRQAPFSSNVSLDVDLTGIPVTWGMNLGFRQQGFVRASAQLTSYVQSTRALDCYLLWRISPSTSIRLSGINLWPSANAESSVFSSYDSTTFRRAITNPSVRAFRAVLEVKL